MPGIERNATHRNTEKLFTQPSSLRGEMATAEIRCDPESAFGNEAGAHGELHSTGSSAAPQPPCPCARQRRGSRHTPGHAADLEALGWDTAGLSLPAQMQITAATGGSKMQLSRHLPCGSPPPLPTGVYPGAFPSPEMWSPTNTEATLYLLSPLPGQLLMEEIAKDQQVWLKAPGFETFSQKTHDPSLSPARPAGKP